MGEKDLPVELPYVEKYQPTDTGESPLASISEWVNVKCPKCGGQAKRETDTMPNWAGSSWYYLRYIDPRNNKTLADKEKLKHWLPVDLYNGGMEHTTLHLLYSRFWHKFLFDIKVVPQDEPYKKRTSHGMVLAEDGRKMSKSYGNVINPDDIIEKYGADSLRLYEMFMGPFEQAIAWNEKGVVGMRRFLEKVWKIGNIVVEKQSQNFELERLTHQTMKKVSEDIENFKFNTAISSLMILVNEMEKQERLPVADYQSLLKLLSVFAPHISEEIWEMLGNKKSIFQEKWPEYDEKLTKQDKINLIIQINGKVRDKIETEANISESEAKKLALSSEKVLKYTEGKTVKKTIFISGKLINIVVI
jgi:leucyl-tRNA synthetase